MSGPLHPTEEHSGIEGNREPEEIETTQEEERER